MVQLVPRRSCQIFRTAVGLLAQAADLDVITVAWTLAPFESAASEGDVDGVADFLVLPVRPTVRLVGERVDALMGLCGGLPVNCPGQGGGAHNCLPNG